MGCVLVFASVMFVAFWMHLCMPLLRQMGLQAYMALMIQVDVLLTLPAVLVPTGDMPICWSWYASGMAAVLYLGLGGQPVARVGVEPGTTDDAGWA